MLKYLERLLVKMSKQPRNVRDGCKSCNEWWRKGPDLSYISIDLCKELWNRLLTSGTIHISLSYVIQLFVTDFLCCWFYHCKTNAKMNCFCSGPVNAMFTMDQDTSWVAATATSNYVYASFPVDVIVYFHMQPSTFRFSCLPVSRVECMLQLPSLDIVFSSKRAEEELHRWVFKVYLWEN